MAKEKFEKLDLHEWQIITDSGKEPLKDYSIKKQKASFDEVEVMFHNIEERIIDLIHTYKDGMIFGCVAWLTSEPILVALSRCENVQIIVQKEDFLRPDIGIPSFWKERIRSLYEQVSFKYDRHSLKEPIGSLSYLGDPTVDGIRCVGNYNFDKAPAFPRSHHKFVVFCEYKGFNKYKCIYTPTTLITGSYNFTHNAKMSFENVLLLHSKKGNSILDAYLNEHHQLFALSESLNWESNWLAPEYRIGT